MRITGIIIAAILIAILVASIASFSMPSLLGRPIVPGVSKTMDAQLPSKALTPADVAAQAADETFTLSLSGNVYYDKLPVKGAVVTVYLNGAKMGRTTAGDLYQFNIPGVKTGDTIRVDADYQGCTGTASQIVKFKSVYLDVNVNSGHSFIRDALELLPTGDELSNEQKPSTASSQAPLRTPATTSGGSTTGSSADTKQMTADIADKTRQALSSQKSQASQPLANPSAADTLGSGGNMKISTLGDAMKASGM